MKNILFVNDIARGGGTEKVLQEITANLPEDEYNITVLTFMQDKDFYQCYKSSIRYWYLYNEDMMPADTLVKKCINHIKRRRRDRYIKQNIRNVKFDIVAAIKEGHVMKYVRDIAAPRKIAWIHTDFEVLHWSADCFAGGAQELECMRVFDRIVCVSDNVMRNVKKYVGDSGNIVVLENPIDEKAVIAKSHEEQNTVRRTTGKLLFVTVGRLCREKGYDMLTEACKMLNSEGYEDLYEVWIVGGGECEKELRNQTEALGVRNIVMVGQQSNPYRFLKDADWFISTSRAEGYAIAPQEAAILGIPVIATDCSGVRELLGNSEYGIVIESNVQSIHDAMQGVITDKQCREFYKDAIVQRSRDIRLDVRMERIKQVLAADI